MVGYRPMRSTEVDLKGLFDGAESSRSRCWQIGVFQSENLFKLELGMMRLTFIKTPYHEVFQR